VFAADEMHLSAVCDKGEQPSIAKRRSALKAFEYQSEWNRGNFVTSAFANFINWQKQRFLYYIRQKNHV